MKSLFLICSTLYSVNSFAADSMAFLKEIVEINSGTDNPEGLDSVRAKLIPKFEAMGFKTRVQDVGSGHKVVSFEMVDAKPELLFIGHIDTVFSKTSPFQKTSELKGKFIGPGVMDMKGGIVLMLDVLALRGDNRKIRIVLNDDEEVGSPFSAPFLKKLAEGIPRALVFEPTLPTGEVIVSHSGAHWIEIDVQGRAAHAGLEFTKGLNACLALSQKLIEVAKLSDLKKKLTVSIGTLEGGTKPNVVCERAKAKVDIRFVDQADLDRTLKAIQKIASGNHGFNPELGRSPSAKVIEIVHIPSMPKTSTDELMKILEATGKEIGILVKGGHASAASDANQLAPIGIQLLAGLGPMGRGAHTDHEELDLDAYPKKVKLVQAFVSKLLK